MKFLAKLLCLLILFSPCLIMAGCSNRIVYSYENAENYSVGDANLTNETISSINVDWICGEVTIEKLDSISTIQISETAEKEIDDNYKLRYMVSGETLYIKFMQSSAKKTAVKLEKQLKISLPSREAVTNNLDIKTTSAKIVINKVDTVKINAESVSGNIEIYNSTVSSYFAKAVSGHVKLCNSGLFDISINTASGDIYADMLLNSKLAFNTVNGNVILKFNNGVSSETVINTTSGNVNVGLPSNVSGFKAKLLTNMGTLTNQFDMRYEDDYYRYGTEGATILVTSVSGSININKITV